MRTNAVCLKFLLFLIFLLGIGSLSAIYSQDIALSTYSGQQEITAMGSITLNSGFSVPSGGNVHIYINDIPLDTVSPSANHPFELSSIILKDSVTADIVGSLAAQYLRQNLTYFDGLGRAEQTLNINASPNGDDIITPISYDGLGRHDKTYLPYTSSDSAGSYRQNAEVQQSIFYQNAGNPSIPVIQNPYYQSIFETSPLGRPVEQGNPGIVWSAGSGHSVKLNYELNGANEVRIWNVSVGSDGINNGATSPGYYAAGQLTKNIATDENGNETIEYEDLDNHTVCRKVQSDASGDFITTQYVYDDLENLAYILPPAIAALSSFSETDINFLNFVFAYHYDQRERLSEKKVPGKGWQYFVYNKYDKPIFSQDAVQRDSSYWVFNKYDTLGREVITGRYNSTATRAALQSLSDTVSINTEYRTTSSTDYSNQSFPTTNTKVYTVNFYDDYGFLSNTSVNANTTLATVPDGSVNETLQTKGILTGTFTNILGTDTYLLSTSYYDDKGRVTKVVADNQFTHQSGGADIITNTYDFAGQLTSTRRVHYNADPSNHSAALIIGNRYTNDQAGRQKQVFETINTQSEEELAEYTYNAIGQLQSKRIGVTDATHQLQKIDYAYNARGWVTEMTADGFSEKLHYQDTAGFTVPAQYNGNISVQQWGQGSTYSHYYKYNYDQRNQLTQGISDEGYNEQGITYDNMGNIVTLTRPKVSATAISYSYSGNLLNAVNGGYARTYTYNSNGSMISDGTLRITYNELGRPYTITGTGVSITNTYDAAGNKITAVNGTTTRQYVAGIEYLNGNIEFIQTSEGIARKSGSSYIFEYNLADHLGNNRYTLNAPNGKVQAQDYYPFGIQIPRYVSGAKNNYLYNGDEWQDGANVYDAINRGYDPTLGRFWQVDAMAEKYVGISAFAFVGNNPIGYSDPIGLEMQKWNGGNNWQDILTWIQHANSGDGIYFDPDDHLPDVTVMGHVVNLLSTQMSNDDAIIAALQELNKHRETISELRPENQISNWQAWLHRFNGKYNPYTRLFEAYYGKSQASYWNESLSPSDRVKAFADFAVAGIGAEDGAFEGEMGYGAAKGVPKYLYHYTSKESAESILKTGLTVTEKRPFIYTTNAGNLSPLQAQIELALPANRALPNTILRINTSGLNPTLIRRVSGNLPGYGAGGGTEFLFNQNIPANLIKIVK